MIRSNSEENLILAASFVPRFSQFPDPWIGYLPFAAWVIKELSPRIFVELGIDSGNSYFSFCQSVAESNLLTKCYAVDTWHGNEQTRQSSEEIFHKVSVYHQEHYAKFSRLLQMTFDDAVDYFAEGSIDLLHINRLYAYEAVKRNFDNWLPKLAPGAVVLLYNINVHEHAFGVWKLWKELQAQYSLHMEFVHSCGLGVLQLDNGPEEKRFSWLVSGTPEQKIMINYFSALGERQIERYESINSRDTISTQNDQITALNAKISHLEREYIQIITSKSWQMTAPVRVVFEFFRNMVTNLNGKTRNNRKIESTQGRVFEFQPPKNKSAFTKTKAKTRFDTICGSLNLSGKGLEIGPSYNPILPKRAGYNVKVVDHTTADNLKNKYAAWGVDTTAIEDVDIIWNSGSLAEAVDDAGSYNFIIGSHVIEHIPDPIRFLQDCHRILKPGGRISLVIPDKRYCFDYYIPLTTTGEWIESYLHHRTTHPARKYFDHHAYAAQMDGNIAWGNTVRGQIKLQGHKLRTAYEMAIAADASKEYLDIHGWKFVPESFELILRELQEIGLMELILAETHSTVGFEFYVVLEKPLKAISPQKFTDDQRQSYLEASFRPRL